MIAVALCSARLLPVVFLCPVLGGSATPMTVKLGVVLSFALCLHHAAGINAPAAITDWLAFVAYLTREATFGLSLGLIASLPFDAARMGGKLVDLFRGSSAEAALPHAGTREAASGDGLYQLLVALVAVGPVFPLIVGGLFHSFALIPLGTFVHSEGAAMHVVTLAGAALGTGLAIGAPIAASTLAVDCLLGLASRANPSMNLQDTGAPLKIMAGGVVFFLTLGVVSERLLTEVAASTSAATALLELAR